MLHRSAAALAMVAMLMAGGVPCVGPEASAATHHDCCLDPNCPESGGVPMADHTMASQATPADCCAMSGDRSPRRSAPLAVPFFAAPPLVALDVLPHTNPIDLRRPPVKPLPTDLHAAPLYLLFSVFQI